MFIYSVYICICVYVYVYIYMYVYSIGSYIGWVTHYVSSSYDDNLKHLFFNIIRSLIFKIRIKHKLGKIINPFYLSTFSGLFPGKTMVIILMFLLLSLSTS